MSKKCKECYAEVFEDQEVCGCCKAGALDQIPEPGDRICECCAPQHEVKLTLNFSMPGYEYHCPKCGCFEEWLGLRKE